MTFANSYPTVESISLGNQTLALVRKENADVQIFVKDLAELLGYSQNDLVQKIKMQHHQSPEIMQQLTEHPKTISVPQFINYLQFEVEENQNEKALRLLSQIAKVGITNYVARSEDLAVEIKPEDVLANENLDQWALIVNQETQNAWDILDSLAGTVIAPEDWSSEHDHYIHGTPKLHVGDD